VGFGPGFDSVTDIIASDGDYWSLRYHTITFYMKTVAV